MPKKTRIAILGIGAVGGYFGGLLAEKYFQSEEIEILFIAKENTVQIVKEKGLKIITPNSQRIVHPHLISNNPEEIGLIDYLICCVKSYDLIDSLTPLKKCIRPNTIILPLLNGLDAKEMIHSILPSAIVWDGCVYIISRLIDPGVVQETGTIHSLYFGAKDEESSKLKQFETILIDSGIECHLSETIEQTVWEKYIFISVVASLTSYLDKSIGFILENEEHRNSIFLLLSEIKAVADAKKIELPNNIIEKTIATMERMPFATTSSMHSDFSKGKRTEFRSLTEYVVKQAKELKVETPEYSKILKTLSSKN